MCSLELSLPFLTNYHQVELEASLQGLLLDLFLDGVEADIAVEFGGEVRTSLIIKSVPPGRQDVFNCRSYQVRPTREAGRL